MVEEIKDIDFDVFSIITKNNKATKEVRKSKSSRTMAKTPTPKKHLLVKKKVSE